MDGFLRTEETVACKTSLKYKLGKCFFAGIINTKEF